MPCSSASCLVSALAIVVRRAERVEVVLRERLLGHLGGSVGQTLGREGEVGAAAVGFDLVQVAGHQLQLGARERGAGVVLERHPAVEIAGTALLIERQHVVGVPGDVSRQIRRLDAMCRAARVVEGPDERGPAVERVGQIREAIVVGADAGDDLGADAPHRAVVERQQRRLRFDGPRRAVLHRRANQRHLAADVLLQQLLRIEQVVFVVLFEHRQAARLRERTQVHGGRIHGGGDVFEAQVQLAGRQREGPHVTHERQAAVVDGEGEVFLLRAPADYDRLGGWSRGGSRPCGPRVAMLTTRAVRAARAVGRASVLAVTARLLCDRNPRSCGVPVCRENGGPADSCGLAGSPADDPARPGRTQGTGVQLAPPSW